MSYAERESWKEDLRIAGWEQNGEGWWVHPRASGLHNFASAVALLKKWIDE